MLAGVTDPPFVREANFFERWLTSARGQVVELICHPGHFDPTLVGRDGKLGSAAIHRRPWELESLSHPSFFTAVRAAGFTMMTAAEVTCQNTRTQAKQPDTSEECSQVRPAA